MPQQKQYLRQKNNENVCLERVLIYFKCISILNKAKLEKYNTESSILYRKIPNA